MKWGIINLSHMYKTTKSEKQVNMHYCVFTTMGPNTYRALHQCAKINIMSWIFYGNRKFSFNVFHVIIISSGNLCFLQILVIHLKLRKPYESL